MRLPSHSTMAASLLHQRRRCLVFSLSTPPDKRERQVHYCPAKFSSSRPNSLKIRPITHSRSRNDLNWKEAGLTSSAGLRGETMTGELWTHRLLATDPTSP